MFQKFLDEITGFVRPDYHEYIKSPQWQRIADAMKEKANNRCQLCHVSGFVRQLHVHHNTYERLGREEEQDLIVLCADCHKNFHDSGIGVDRKVKLSKQEFSLVLKNRGITYTNDDPYHYYELGKCVIQDVIDGFDSELYDYYNSVNIEILNAAIDNISRREYEEAKASENWNGYYYERDWRDANDYWVGWER